ncbi:aminopeptidase P family protein [Ruegeria pomeroyi]|nr:aminopeptidase P family protein [Ruegeria pomeroyi]
MHPDRIQSALAVIEDNELDAAILFDPAAQFYFLGHDSFAGVNTPQALVLSPRLTRPRMVIWAADAPMLPGGGDGLDLRLYHFGVDSPASALADVLDACFPSGARFGWDAQSAALNHALASDIIVTCGIEPVDISDAITALRAIKTPKEIADMRKAGEMVEHGLAALRHFARAGNSEREVAAEIEKALRTAGSDYWAVPIELASGARAHCAHGTPAERILEPGDLLHVEFGAVHNRYHAVGIQSVAVERPASPEISHAYETARRCLAAGLATARPGLEASEVEAPALDLLRQEGFGDAFAMRFGYSVGIGYPPTWLEPFGITRSNHQPIVPGMTLVMHACILDAPSRLGVLVGGTYVMGSDGLVCLAGAGDVPLHVTGLC